MDPYGTSFLREKWGSFQVETGVPPGRKIAIHSYTYIYIHIFYVNKYIYIHMFQSSKFILSMPNLSFSRICPPKNQGPVCLKRARCVTRMPCSIWPTPWMPRFYGGGRCLVGSVALLLLDWPGNECRRCIGGLEILHLGVFCWWKMVCGIKMWRDFSWLKTN